MSKKDKFSFLSAGLNDVLNNSNSATQPAQQKNTKTAPGQLLAFRGEMTAYEDRIAKLTADLNDARRTALAVDLIDPNPWQPRTFFDSEEIKELALSIKEVGLIQPIIVRKAPSGDRYQLIAGERRLRAHKELGIPEIKVIVDDVQDVQLAIMALAENLDRKDLSDYEISKAVRRIENDFPNRTSLANAIGVSRSELYRYLSFNSLPNFIKNDLDIEPRILGGSSAEQITNWLKDKGEAGIHAIQSVWPKFRSGMTDQSKIVSAAISFLAANDKTGDKADREAKKFYFNNTHAGSITKDGNSLTVKLKTKFLTEEKEQKLNDFIRSLFKDENENLGQ